MQCFIDSCDSVTVIISARTLSARHGKASLAIARDVSHFEQQSFAVIFLLVRTPEQGSVRPTYSFVQMTSAISAAEHAATTRSRPVRAAHIH